MGMSTKAGASARAMAQQLSGAESRRYAAGAKGERSTARRIAWIAFWRRHLHNEKWHVFHDLAIPASSANIDHIVVNPYGVFLVDSKNWAKDLYIGRDHSVLYAGNAICTDATLFEKELVEAALALPVLAIWSIGKFPSTPFVHKGVQLGRRAELKTMLIGPDRLLSPDMCSKIAGCISDAFP